MPRDMDDRVVLAVADTRSGPLGTTPAGAADRQPPGGAVRGADHVAPVTVERRVEHRGDAETLGLRDVTGGLDERGEGGVGDRGGVDVERPQTHPVDRGLPVQGVALVEVVAHHEGAAGQSHLSSGTALRGGDRRSGRPGRGRAGRSTAGRGPLPRVRRGDVQRFHGVERTRPPGPRTRVTQGSSTTTGFCGMSASWPSHPPGLREGTAGRTAPVPCAPPFRLTAGPKTPATVVAAPCGRSSNDGWRV